MLPYSDEGDWVEDDPEEREMGLDVSTLPLREMRSGGYKVNTRLADRGMMMGLGKRVIADRGEWCVTYL